MGPGAGDTSHRQHFLAITMVLRSESREEFRELVRCVEAVREVWPDMEEEKGSLKFMKHFYYEVGVSTTFQWVWLASLCSIVHSWWTGLGLDLVKTHC